MANTFKDLKVGLSDTKTRSIFIIIIIILLAAVVIGYLSLRSAVGPGAAAQGGVKKVPGIRSIPGVGTPSRHYVELQRQQNLQIAQEAAKKGTAAVPTITRATYVGGDIGPEFPANAQQNGAVNPPGCSVDELRRAREAGVTAFELRCRGCSAAALKAAGYTAGELRNAGFSAKDLKDAGFTAAQLRDAGFSAKDLKDAGFTAAQLSVAGFSPKELQDAGFTPQELAAAGIDASKLAAVDCSIAALRQAHTAGTSAAQLKSCGAAALKAAGYTAKELKDAGFTAGELRNAGFTAQQLKAAGFTAKQLKDAGFSAKELKDAGFTPQELKDAGFTAGDLIRAGFSPNEISPVATVPGIPAIGSTATVPSIGLTPGQQQKADLEKQLAEIRARQAAEMSQQEWDNQKQELEQNMASQANDLFASWTPLPKQQYVEGQAPQAAQTGSATQAATTTATNKQQITNGQVFKAGTVLFAVLDTSINSDEKSPIMATVIQGPLKGAKMLGQFNRVAKKVVLQFSILSVPYLQHTIAVNAYAIDPNTARTALATSVDNHYLLRYGTLFAASFMNGLGEAIQNSGSSTTVGPFTIQHVWKNLNAGQQVMVGLGKAGEKFGSVLQPLFNKPPTVKVNAGNGIGLLLMADLTVPERGTQ